MSHTFGLSTRFFNSAKAILVLGGFAAILLVAAPSAQATPIGPNQAVLAAGEIDPGPGSIQVADTGPLPFTAATFSGTLETFVYQDTTNPFGPGLLTFVYLLKNDPTSNSAIERLSINGFSGFATDVSYQVPDFGIRPFSFDRSSLATDGANVVGESFLAAPLGPGVLAPGATSDLFVVQTDATRIHDSFAAVQDGTNTSAPTLAPAPFNPAPEPSSIVLGMIGLAGFTVVARRRKTV